MKFCQKCGVDKLELNFNKKKSSKDGYSNWCKLCSKEYLKSYHIMPLSRFPKETPLSEVNALSNLQPLWAFENLSKNNKMPI